MILTKFVTLHKHILVLCTSFLFVSSFYFWYRNQGSIPEDNFYDVPFSKFLIYNNKCQIPDIDPWHYEAKAVFRNIYFKPKNIALLVKMQRIERDVFLVAEKNYTGFPNLNCTCCDVVHGDGSVPDDSIRRKNCKTFTNFIKMNSPIVEVRCYSWSVPVFRDVFANYIWKDLSKNNIRNRHENNSKHFNVMVVGIDSISRIGFLRLLPKTDMHLLQKQWIRFEAYNKVGENTLPNVMALLAGSNNDYGDHIYFDDEPFIWKAYKKKGYVTVFAENGKTTNTFNINKYGFRRPPTDFYFRPYTIAMEDLYTETLNNMNYMTGGRLTDGRLLDLALELPQATKKFFGYFWLSYFSHDDPNVPQLVDDRLVEFLEQLEHIGTYKDTIIFLLADHGFRLGSLRLTTRGWYEDRLPFLYVYVPEVFKKKYPQEYKHLRDNSKKLVSSYDLYITLQDILRLSNYNHSIKIPNGCLHCSSIFLQMPDERSCANAGVLDRFCSCFAYRTLIKSGPLSLQLSHTIIDKVNKIVDGDSSAKMKCRTFRLHRIIDAAMANSTSGDALKYRVKIIVEVRPMATFEGHFTGSSVLGGIEYKLLAVPFRLDTYGKTSWCIQKPHIKRFCYCIL